MLHYVHQLVANFINLLFGAEQGVYNVFIRIDLPATGNYTDKSFESEPRQSSYRQ